MLGKHHHLCLTSKPAAPKWLQLVAAAWLCRSLRQWMATPPPPHWRQQWRWRPFIMAHAVATAAAALYCCLLRDAASIEYCGASHSKAGFATSVSAVSTQELSSKPSTSMAEQEAPLLHYSAVVSKNYEQSSVGCCTLQRSHGQSDSPQGAACALVNR